MIAKNLIKTIFINIALSLTIFSFYNANCKTINNLKELMIIVDYHKAETIYHTLTQKNTQGMPQGCGAITLGALAAFEQKAAPMLLSKVLWENIYHHAQVFKDFANLNYNNLINKYNKFNRFKNPSDISNFKQICSYFKKIYPHINQEIIKLLKNDTANTPEHIQKIFLDITNNSKFSYSNAPACLRDYHFNPQARDIYTDAIIFFICECVVHNINNWTIKQVDDNTYLFIHNEHLEKLQITPQDLCFNNQNDKNNISKTELNLGLKVNHFKTIDPKVNMQLKHKDVASIEFDRSIKFVPVLERLFVSLQDYKSNSQDSPKWTLYLDGHGLSSYSIKKELRKFKKIQKYYQNILDKKFPCCDKARKQNNIAKHLQECPLAYEYQRINPEIQQVNNAINTINKHLKNKHNPLEGTIISLPISEFKNVLNFFNSKINTEFVYYSSCYAGGEHLVTPYLTQEDKPLNLNYYVAVGTLSENVSQLEVPHLSLPPYKDYQMNCYALDPQDSIDIKNKCLKLYTKLDFNKFFDSIKQNQHSQKTGLDQVVSYVNPYLDKDGKLKKSCLGNLPAVRRPNTNNFVFISGNQKLECINNQTKFPKVINNNVDAILLSDKASKGTIIIKKVVNASLPPIVSLWPGEAAHEINKLDVRQFTLTEVINAFSQLPQFSASKIFKIKELIVKPCKELSNLVYTKTNRSAATLNNFIISHKIHDTNNINKMKQCLSITMPTPNELITGVFFKIKNLVYSIPWFGNQIRNLSIKRHSPKHNNMLLAYHEELSDRPILG